MPMIRSKDGQWELIVSSAKDREKVAGAHPGYLESLPRYPNLLDPLFERAKAKCEAEFVLCLLRIKGIQAPGNDPYLTTARAIPAVIEASGGIVDFEPLRHLTLWIYGHIIEASESYEIMANLLDVISGGRYHVDRFPNQWSPTRKIEQLKILANAVGEQASIIPLEEIWDRDLRNAIFHSDYALYGNEVRISKPVARVYSSEEVDTLINRAIAFQETITGMIHTHIAAYAESKLIEIHPSMSGDPEERAVVVVRTGYGVTGLKSAWTREQIRAGRIPSIIGRFTPEEMRLLNENPELAHLPSRRAST